MSCANSKAGAEAAAYYVKTHVARFPGREKQERADGIKVPVMLSRP